MLRSIALIPLLSLLLPFSLRAQSEGDSLITDLLLLLPREDAWPPAPRQVYPASFFRDILLHPGLGNFLDNSVHAVVFQTETAGDIGLADPLVFSLQGSSWLWNRYYLDGLRNDDPWQTGHLLYQPPMQHTSLGLDPNGPALHFSTEALQRPWASVTYNHGDLGGISGFTQPMVEWFHRTATDRLKRPLPGRRHLEYATEVQFGTPLVGQGHQLSGQFLLGRRRMPDISFAGLDAFYPENFGRMMLHYQRPAGRISLGALFNAESRDNYYSEAYYSPRETARFRSATATAYGIVRRAHFLANLALTAGLRDLRHHDPGFSRNILDQDGEGFEPWYPSSTDRFLSLQGALDRSLCGGLRLLAHTQNHLLMFRPLQEEMLNPVFLMNDHSWQSLFAARWTSADFNGGLLENRLGLGWEGQWARGLDISLQSFLSLDGLLLQGNSHLSPGLEARLRLDWEPLPWLNISLDMGHRKIPYQSQQLRFFSPQWLSGTWVYWDDADGDRHFQEAEARGDYLYSGGAWHRWTGGLRQSGLVFLDLPIAFSTGKYGTLFLHNHYKQFTRSWDVRFAGDALDYGHYEDRDGQAVFFFDRPPQYEVVGLERSGMQAVTGYGGWFRSNPHAMGNTIGFRREAPRFYLDLAWTSHMIIGYSAMGYGFMHNSPGILSESLAQPNTRTRMFGRSDADRGYYAKLLLGWKISKSLSTSFQFAWVDGQPFTKFLYYTDEDQAQRQLALWPYVERGNSGWSGDFGPREDGFFDSVLRMQYQRAFGGHSLGMVLSVYNLFDFGTNLAEYAFPEGDSRYVLEFTAPRGMMLRVWMEL